MRNFLKILCCTFLIIGFSSCNEDFEDDSQTNGVEYFDFKVDGRHFEGIGIPAQCNARSFDYFLEPYLDLPAGYMAMGVNNCEESATLTLTFQRVTPEYTGTSSLDQPNFAESFQPLFISTDNQKYHRLLDGTMTINEFTGRKKGATGRLTGTFEMRLVDSEKTDTINITDGRFSFLIPQKIH